MLRLQQVLAPQLPQVPVLRPQQVPQRLNRPQPVLRLQRQRVPQLQQVLAPQHQRQPVLRLQQVLAPQLPQVPVLRPQQVPQRLNRPQQVHQPPH
ncbi:TPA: hypothetical protein ACOO3X_002126, partial [Streptococcus pneumoniae]